MQYGGKFKPEWSKKSGGHGKHLDSQGRGHQEAVSAGVF
jgi:hypothetical protein